MDIAATKLATAAETELGGCMVEIRWAACDTVRWLRELLGSWKLHRVDRCTDWPRGHTANRDYNAQMSAGDDVLYYNSGPEAESRHSAQLVTSVPSRLIIGAICGDPRRVRCAFNTLTMMTSAATAARGFEAKRSNVCRRNFDHTIPLNAAIQSKTNEDKT